ncbi:hypothetical protein VTO42DRAFT_7140 [Malbranchea cinnamomea]
MAGICASLRDLDKPKGSRNEDDDLVAAIRASLSEQKRAETNQEASTKNIAGDGGLLAEVYAALGEQHMPAKDGTSPWKQQQHLSIPSDKSKEEQRHIHAHRTPSIGEKGDGSLAVKSSNVRTGRAIVVDSNPFQAREPKFVENSNTAADGDSSPAQPGNTCEDAGLMSVVRATINRQQVPRQDWSDIFNDRQAFEPEKTARQKKSTVKPLSVTSREATVGEQTVTAFQTSSLREARRISGVPSHERPQIAADTECTVCADVFGPEEIAMGLISSTCDHSSPEAANKFVCKGCLQQHLDVQVQSGANRLTCPICLAELAYYDIKKWALPRTFARYDRLRMRDAITADPNFIWCSNPNCEAGQVHESGSDAPIVICQSCGTKTCFNHQKRWHEGLTCAEFDNPDAAAERLRRERVELEATRRRLCGIERGIPHQVQTDEELARRLAWQDGRQAAERNKAEEQRRCEEEERRRKKEDDEAERKRRQKELENAERLQKQHEEERAQRLEEERLGVAAVLSISKPCPGPKCSFRVQKIDGCKHMTCSRCQFEWCWVCGQKWKRGHLSVNCSPSTG